MLPGGYRLLFHINSGKWFLKIDGINVYLSGSFFIKTDFNLILFSKLFYKNRFQMYVTVNCPIVFNNLYYISRSFLYYEFKSKN